MLDRALTFLWALADTCADEVVAVAPGSVLRTPSLPAMWTLNALRVEGDHLSLGVDDLAALADAHLGHVPYRRIEIEDTRASARLEEPFRDAGWTIEREVLLGFGGAPDRIVDTSAVRAAAVDELRPLERAWAEEDDEAPDASSLLGAWDREHHARPELRFVVDDEHGVAAMTLLRWHGRTAQVEDVYTRRDARGRGYARMLVTHALQVAQEHGHDHVFLVADADETARELYAKLGFVEIGRRLRARRHSSLRPPA